MPSGRQGSIHLFRLAGVDLYLHWSWFLVAANEIQSRVDGYSSVGWSVPEYLALFLIVLTHEFGHAMACRSVGGTADQILLWPFGGVAYVRPPQRPGATLWSIAAGPLVNVVLAPVLYWRVSVCGGRQGGRMREPDLYLFVQEILYIDLGLLVFNMLPIYPLDGGQILRSLLWFCAGARAQPDGGDGVGACRRRGAGCVCGVLAGCGWRRSALYLRMNCWNALKRRR